MADKQRISYVALEDMTPEMRVEMERCAREGTPRPESSAVRAHVPAAFWFFANSWRDLFHTGVVDHAIKELCRVYISRSVKCEYCGNQRSEKGRSLGLVEGQYDELLNFEDAEGFTERQKAAGTWVFRMRCSTRRGSKPYARFAKPSTDVRSIPFLTSSGRNHDKIECVTDLFTKATGTPLASSPARKRKAAMGR